MSKARAKGTLAETAIVKYLNENGFPDVERRVFHGTADQGDLIFPAASVVVEIKNCGRYDIPGWLLELDREIANAGAKRGYLVVKPKGVGTSNVGAWWVIERLAQWADHLVV